MHREKRLRREAREVPLFAYLPELLDFRNTGTVQVVISGLGGPPKRISLDRETDPLVADPLRRT